MLTQEDLEQIGKLLDKKFSPLEQRVTELGNEVAKIDRQVTGLGDDVARLQRTVSTIESFPLPYSRPKSFHYATEYHSVSASIRKRQGHMG